MRTIQGFAVMPDKCSVESTSVLKYSQKKNTANTKTTSTSNTKIVTTRAKIMFSYSELQEGQTNSKLNGG
jgi:tRNA A37 methylthiotransferase MiaB